MTHVKLDIFSLLTRIRQQQPVVHHLTNWVTIYDCAQVVKVLGGSPVMAHAPEEAAEMNRLAQALVLNIGTLTVPMVEAMKLAAIAANTRGIPVVLDACGVGATGFRDQQAAELLDAAAIDIIKGNASEIARLAGEAARTRGVDAGELNADLKEVALRLAQERQATVVITGAEDVVTDGRRLFVVKNGDPLMSRVVGTGCMAASVIGAFAAVSRDYPVAAAAGLSAFGVAAQGAARKAQGPGSFKELLFDHLYHLDQATLDTQQCVEEMLKQ